MKLALFNRLVVAIVVLVQYALLSWDGSINRQLIEINHQLIGQLERANVALRMCADRSQRSAD